MRVVTRGWGQMDTFLNCVLYVNCCAYVCVRSLISGLTSGISYIGIPGYAIQDGVRLARSDQYIE